MTAADRRGCGQHVPAGNKSGGNTTMIDVIGNFDAFRVSVRLPPLQTLVLRSFVASCKVHSFANRIMARLLLA